MTVVEIVLFILKILATALGMVAQKNAEPKVMFYDGKGANAVLANHYRGQWDDRLRRFQAETAANPAPDGAPTSAPVGQG